MSAGDWEALIRGYAADLPTKAGAIERAAKAIDEQLAAGAAPDWQGLASLAHKLAGSSGTYGFARVSDVARRLEEEIMEERLTRAPADEARASLCAWLADFRREVDNTQKKRSAA